MYRQEIDFNMYFLAHSLYFHNSLKTRKAETQRNKSFCFYRMFDVSLGFKNHSAFCGFLDLASF